MPWGWNLKKYTEKWPKASYSLARTFLNSLGSNKPDECWPYYSQADFYASCLIIGFTFTRSQTVSVHLHLYCVLWA